MKKFLKRFLKWTGITLLLLIIALILVPIIFKDQIKELVIKEVNKSLTAELSLDDIDLTFLSTFPSMTIELTGVKLTGKDKFEGVKLTDIGRMEAKVGFWSVVAGDQIEVDEIHIYDPSFDVRVLQDGSANYDIVKPDSLKTEEELEEPSSFKLSLKEYSINNANIKYDDRSLNMYAVLDSVQHTGKGDLTADVINFETTTNMHKLSYGMDGISYLTEVKTDAVVNILMNFTDESSKFTLKENEIKLNAVTFSIDGFYELFEDRDEMDLKLDASKSTFKDFLSLIPTFYQSGYEGMVAGGNLKLNGLLKGTMTDTDLPAWDFGMKVSGASIKYPDLPGKITNIGIDAGSKFPGGADMNKMTVDVNRFHANLKQNTIDANLLLRNMLVDPYIQSKILAKVDLATMKEFIPVAEGESYNGKLDADVNIKGAMSALDAGDFERFTASGNVNIHDMKYKSPDVPDEVSINALGLGFSPQEVTLKELDGKMSGADFRMHGKLENFFGYMLRDDVLKGDFAMNSNYIDLDRLIPAEEGEPAPPKKGDVVEPVVQGEEEPILIPANIDFRLNSTMNKVKYNGINVSNVVGTILLKDETATLENLRMNAMGGVVGLHGSYNTKDHAKPKVDFGYKLEEIDIQELASNFLTVGKIAPIAKLASGKISSDFDMQTLITPSFEPILTSLSSIGDIRSKALSFKDIRIFKKIENVTKLKSFSSQKIDNFKTKFTINDGKVSMLPCDIKLGNIPTNISGYTTLDQKMNYNFLMNVPKEEIPQSMIKEVEKAMGQLNALVPQLDIGKLPDFIPVKVNASGDAKDPKITTDFKEAILKATGDFKENAINTVTQTVKDTVQNVINQGVEDAKEEIEKQKQKILADAQKEADKVKAEAKKAADAVRDEAKKQGDALIKEAGSNPLKKKAAEIAAKKLTDEAEVKAKKIEAEGNKKADDIIAKARERADKLG